MSVIEKVHGGYVHGRRVRTLCRLLAQVLPERSSVLDVGCGDGLLDHLLVQARPDLSIQGVEVLARPDAHIKVTMFDGKRLPFPDQSFDAVMFVDVLHHIDDPMILLREARRVARRAIVIKDHLRDGVGARATLRFMDWVGNARHGVRLPYNYWPAERWNGAFSELKVRPDVWIPSLRLYPFPADLLFGRGLHFVAKLVPTVGS